MPIVHPMEGIERDAAGNARAPVQLHLPVRGVLHQAGTDDYADAVGEREPVLLSAAGDGRDAAVVFEDSAGQQYEDSKRIELA
jgi:hypothetical protein